MTNVAIVLAPGFEEIEAVVPIDILRRANINVTIFGGSEEVTGSHNITLKVDKLLDQSLTDYDMIILPGGQPGSTNLRDNEQVIETLKYYKHHHKYVAAICAAPLVLDKAGLLIDKKYVSFPGTEQEINTGTRLADEIVVVDGKLITARGAGAAFEFAYTLVEVLEADSNQLREGMEYSKLFEK